MKLNDFTDQIQWLTGSPIKKLEEPEQDRLELAIDDDSREIDSSQFNELLLMVNKDRVSKAFFNRFFCNCRDDGEHQCKIGEITAGIKRFQATAMLEYGNFIYAYRQLSRTGSTAEIRELLGPLADQPAAVLETQLRARKPPLLDIEPITRDDTHLIGYLSAGEIVAEHSRATMLVDALLNSAKFERLEATSKGGESANRKQADAVLEAAKALSNGRKPEEVVSKAQDDQAILQQQRDRLDQIQAQGLRNTDVYLTWDHMDVYFATSMRRKWEYEDLYDFVDKLVNRAELKDLNLRYFDPTQSFETNRIDKGLVEALMLKRAACTVYSVQDTDTLGKDSELAVTLAQGKPVIAYAPTIGVDERAAYLMSQHPTMLRERLEFVKMAGEGARHRFASEELGKISDALVEFDRSIIWKSVPDKAAVELFRMDQKDILPKFCKALSEYEGSIYDKRADTLKRTHPLAIQVNLDTGVANGVIVARDVGICAELIRRILTNSMKYRVVDDTATDSWHLVEDLTNSIFRVVTRNAKLTNSFWNFYRKDLRKGAANA